MNSRDKAIISKIRAEADTIASLISKLDLDIFLSDERTKRAVCMTLINIGELVKLLSDDYKKAHDSIPWRKISGLRDVAAHGYFTLRMTDIWETVVNDIPDLSEKLKNDPDK